MTDVRKILIVDDNKNDRFFFTIALEEVYPQAICIESADAIHALEYLQEEPLLPQFIFLDSQLHLLSSIDFLHIIKKDDRLHHIPVIIYSGSDNPEAIENFAKAGSAFYLKKPNFESLAAEIQNAIETVATSQNL